MDLQQYNRNAWNHLVENDCEWTRPVSAEKIRAAKAGTWDVILTGHKPVPKSWFPPLQGLRILGLASGGGQQGPVLAAAGAEVTIVDNSDQQLAQDRKVADRDHLQIHTLLGDMTRLEAIADESFDLVFNPCSVCFVEDVRAVWREAFRVLVPGGKLLTGFLNPAVHIFDETKAEQGELEVRHSVPYSDRDCLTPEEQAALRAKNEPFMFGHTLTTLIGGQIEAGFRIMAMYEDIWEGRALSKYMPSYIATQALKPE